MRNLSRSRGASGFTLVEILAVIAILGLLVSLAVPAITKARASGNARACQSNLRQISQLLQSYVDNRNKGRWPKESGIKFLLILAEKDEVRGESLDIFVCPGTDDVTWVDDADPTPGTGFADWDNLEPGCISYAGRDNRNFPLNKNRLDEEVIAADDNDGRPNHEHITNYVYADSRTSQADVSDFSGELEEGLDYIPVGPDSPHEGLAKLLVDY